MARPETHSDLREDLLQEHVASFYSVDMTDPDQLRALAKAITAVRRAKGDAEADNLGGVRLWRPAHESVVQSRLRAAQADWDRRELGWRNAIEGIAYVKAQWERTAIDSWAKAEERVAVDWPPLEEEKVDA
ncbi:hypothetical protein FK268_12655 [Tsukamurella sputi]|uniref:Uncharacterized protein n=1 Tax=Tsukamurella sputi TaxID=2591848 RepID=A0A5C5RPK8_9ACTN|nr:hypothetical protein [Tsukamurella sputi]TWS24433.1 hypothetical protein FK268_12655 [Tsukamurella sputi]